MEVIRKAFRTLWKNVMEPMFLDNRCRQRLRITHGGGERLFSRPNHSLAAGDAEGQACDLEFVPRQLRIRAIQFTTATDAIVLPRAIARHTDAELRYPALNPCGMRPSDAVYQLVSHFRSFAHSWLIAANAHALVDDVD
jgi:hypothetical protein